MLKSTPLWVNSYPKNLKWDAQIEAKPVFSLLEDTTKKFGTSPGFSFLGKTLSWGRLNTQVNQFAKGLQDKLSLKKGQRVGLFLPNCPYFLIAYYGILKAGGTVVNFNPLYAEKELEYQIEDAEVDIMITVDVEMLYEKMSKMLSNTRLQKLILAKFDDLLPFPKNILYRTFKAKDIAKVKNSEDIYWYHDLINNNGDVAPVDISPETDIAVLQYTGGTTGVPKGAMLTHANVYANVIQVERWFYNIKTGQEKMVGILPFFHVFAMTAVMNISVRFAMELCALPRFDLDQTLKLIHKERPTFFPAVPAIYTAMNNHKKIDHYDLSSVKYCISGGAPLPVEVKKKFEEMTGCVLVEGYGLTESAPVACVNPIEGENKAGSIGLPLPATHIVLRDPETGDDVALGEKGELCIKGPQVMLGYWNKPDATKDTFTEDGYLKTGDIAIQDEDGYFFIVDRIKDLIITNGYNVYPRHVEEAIYLHPNIEECIVGGIPDKNRGEIVKAWIKVKDGRELDEGDLRAFLEDKISKIEQPRIYEFRDEPLPKTMIGKLSRKEIIAQETK